LTHSHRSESHPIIFQLLRTEIVDCSVELVFKLIQTRIEFVNRLVKCGCHDVIWSRLWIQRLFCGGQLESWMALMNIKFHEFQEAVNALVY